MTQDQMFKFIFGLLLIQWAQRYIAERVEFAPCDKHQLPCWVWKRSGDGRYGHAYLLGARIKAHVLSFIAFGGSLKRHEIVDHEGCDRYACCQPAHLRAASESQNMKRCFNVGRGRSPFLRGAQ